MPQLSLGEISIIVGALMFVGAAIYGLWPVLFKPKMAQEEGRIRIRESEFLPNLTPSDHGSLTRGGPSPSALEEALASWSQSTPVAAPSPVATPYRLEEPQTIESIRPASYDEGLVEELFAELFAVRASLGELASDLRSLRAAWEAREDAALHAVSAADRDARRWAA